jgi:molybdopterin-guanine dinucleotide biosynthesis protein A
MIPVESNLPGLILAGGKSSRMGQNKAQLPLSGKTILGHVVDRLAPQVTSIVLNATEASEDSPGLRLVPDLRPGQAGPLEGVLAGLKDLQAQDTDAPPLVTVPCDSPFLPLDLVARLTADAGPETIAVATSDGRTHPVFAIWPKAIADDLEAWLAAPENRRLRAFLDRHQTVYVDFPVIDIGGERLDPFLNINTPEDLALAKRFTEVLK